MERTQPSHTKKATVVDLDGTIITVNSFPAFFRMVIKHSLCHSPASLTRLAMCGLLRRSGFISHKRLKWELLRYASKKMSDSDMSDFADSLLRHTNPKVAEVLQKEREAGATIILATAAPEIYAAPLALRLHIDHYVATRYQSDFTLFSETRKNEKLRKAMETAKQLGLKIVKIISDHHDDLPLMKIPGVETILVSPSEKTVSELENAGINYIRIN